MVLLSSARTCLPGAWHRQTVADARGQEHGQGLRSVFYALRTKIRHATTLCLARPAVHTPPRIKVPTLAETDIDAGAPGSIEAFNVLTANTWAINYMGLPAVSVPCGLDSRGLPIGFQIQGRPFGEGRILKVADAYQRDTDWHQRRPSLRG
jgi:Asp-tRNA(Asn)/Glu-tRNA(Gln) amidotransferase A subunit family amidase